MQVHNVEQGTTEWLALRCGIITCSELNAVMASGRGSNPSKTRLTYMYKLIGERFTGEPSDNYSNSHMERGHALEPEARALYEEQNGITVQQVGFITNHGIGFSPDGLIPDGLIEIKTKLPHLQAELLDRNQIPPEHMKQIQGGLWVSERQFADFISYWPGMPMFVQRVERDDTTIAAIAEAVGEFYAELTKRMERIEKHAYGL